MLAGWLDPLCSGGLDAMVGPGIGAMGGGGFGLLAGAMAGHRRAIGFRRVGAGFLAGALAAGFASLFILGIIFDLSCVSSGHAWLTIGLGTFAPGILWTLVSYAPQPPQRELG